MICSPKDVVHHDLVEALLEALMFAGSRFLHLKEVVLAAHEIHTALLLVWFLQGFAYFIVCEVVEKTYCWADLFLLNGAFVR